MPTQGRQIIGLDLVRLGAASMVMLFHLGNIGPLKAWTWWGWVGVPIFFVLSGFVISYSAETASAGQFLRGRLLRLAPGIWICGTVTLAGWLIVGGDDMVVRRYVDTITLWPWGPWIDGVYWTLPIEVAFYLFVFALLWVRAFDRAIIAFAALASISLGYWLVQLAAQRWPAPTWATALPGRDAQILLLEQGCYFALGGAMWLIFRRGPNLPRVAVALIGYLGGALQCAFFARAFSATSPLAVPEGVFLLGSLLVAVAIWHRAAIDSRLGRFAVQIRVAGLATYPFYLLHDDAGMMVRDALTPLGAPQWAAVGAAALAAVAASVAVTLVAERPVRAMLNWLLGLATRRGNLQPAAQAEPL